MKQNKKLVDQHTAKSSSGSISFFMLVRIDSYQ